MLVIKKRTDRPLVQVYYTSFFLFIVIPLLIVLVAVLLILNRQFQSQAVENMERAQDAVITELNADIDTMSMRLSHLIYTNNSEILELAAGTDTGDGEQRYLTEGRLSQAANLVLEPVKDVISVGFYMKSGSETYLKSQLKTSTEEIKSSPWYMAALENPNSVCVGAYNVKDTNELYTGSRKGLMILIFALAPDVGTDRSGKIEMVTFYQSTGAADKINANNLAYQAGRNKLGVTRVIDGEGRMLFCTQEDGLGEVNADVPQNRTSIEEVKHGGVRYTCVTTPVILSRTIWYVQSIIPTSELTQEYWHVAGMVLLAAVLILLSAAVYSRFFLRSIVHPVEEISVGLHQVEEGNLDVHISPAGQAELRHMIHQFNAMVRQQKALITEYEERVKGAQRTPGEYFAAMARGEMSPEDVASRSRDLFQDRYLIMGIFIENYNASALERCFERNPRFSSRCIFYTESPQLFLVYYRIAEETYYEKAEKMALELQKAGSQETGAALAFCIGREASGPALFQERLQEVRDRICLRHLLGEHPIVNLAQHYRECSGLLEKSKEFDMLASALCIADEKNMMVEKEKLFSRFSGSPEKMEENRMLACAAIQAIAMRFESEGSHFKDVFGKQYHYVEKISRLEDVRSLKLWFANYFAWIMDYSASRLNIAETDLVVKAKRYISDHYEDAGLSLGSVAEYVELNEKYFSNRFTRETGETFSSFLTGLRIQKSKELLKTTSFRVYEIAEMVGYNNVEHYNRMFKKQCGMSPAQYRKG